MSNLIDAVLPHVQQRSPASERVLTELTQQVHLPADYLSILGVSNGLEGSVNSRGYIRLWKAEELIEGNEDYKIEEFTPGLFLIGSDGGEMAYGLDMRPFSSTYGYYVTLPFISIGWREVEPLSSTFAEFIEAVKRRTPS